MSGSILFCLYRDLRKFRLKQKIRERGLLHEIPVEGLLGTPESVALDKYLHWLETSSKAETNVWSEVLKGEIGAKEIDAALRNECLLFGKSCEGRVLAWLCSQDADKKKKLGDHMIHFLRHDAFARNVDTDGNGSLDEAEWHASGNRDIDFRAADLDGDGTISEVPK